MFKKTLKEAKAQAPSPACDELAQLLNEIDDKQNEISVERERMKKERLNGARATKHRFTV
ncbi:hypothetical protein PO461_07960 [Enterobacter asburiae]|uniref:hypothetical protein n=1 Tax=Enterobacter asburiae TaxID=61645 RepID=UPI002FF5D42F